MLRHFETTEVVAEFTVRYHFDTTINCGENTI